jgi:hypothetical protein
MTVLNTRSRFAVRKSLVSLDPLLSRLAGSAGILLAWVIVLFASNLFSAEPRKVQIGCYLENLRNFDYINGTFRADLYLWVKSSTNDPESLENLDFVRARPTWSSPLTKWNENGEHYESRNYLIEVNHNWDIAKFPFDTQRLRIKVEDLDDSQASLNFMVDPESRFAPNFFPPEWEIRSKKVYIIGQQYDTNFGAKIEGINSSIYSRFIIEVILTRHALSLFFKLVAGAYAAFAAICLSFWLRADVPTFTSGRFGIIVGCIFGTIINQRVVESVVGRSSTVTHIDAIHILTLFSCILAGIITLISTHLATNDRFKASILLDRIAFWVILIGYVGFNAILVGYDYWSIGTIPE